MLISCRCLQNTKLVQPNIVIFDQYHLCFYMYFFSYGWEYGLELLNEVPSKIYSLSSLLCYFYDDSFSKLNN